MSKPNSPLYAGDYQRRARAVRARANADSATQCEYIDEHGHRCGRTLAQHPPTRSGRPPRWSAGHPDGEHGNPRAVLVPQVLGCNLAERNERINAHPTPQTFTSQRW